MVFAEWPSDWLNKWTKAQVIYTLQESMGGYNGLEGITSCLLIWTDSKGHWSSEEYYHFRCDEKKTLPANHRLTECRNNITMNYGSWHIWGCLRAWTLLHCLPGGNHTATVTTMETKIVPMAWDNVKNRELSFAKCRVWSPAYGRCSVNVS